MTPPPTVTASLPSVEATEALGALLAAKSRKGDIFFLHGELGAGKTALSRGFLRYFFQNAQLDVPSPTYLLHFVYQQDAPEEGKKLTEEEVVGTTPKDHSMSTHPSDDTKEILKKTSATTARTSDSTMDHLQQEQLPPTRPTQERPSQQHPEKKIVFKASRFAHIPNCSVHHLDPYRLPAGRIAGLVDFEKIFREDVCLIEWPERLGTAIKVPHERVLHVYLSGVGVQAEAREARLVPESVDKDKNLLSSNDVAWDARLKDFALASAAEGAQQRYHVSPSLLSEFFIGKALGGGSSSSCTDYMTNNDTESTVDQSPQSSEQDNADCSVDKERENRAKVESCKLGKKIDTYRTLPPEDVVVLGIESSCDDTGCAIVTADGKILGECVASQAGIHEMWGGVKPDAAQEAHKKAIHETVSTCIDLAKQNSNGRFKSLQESITAVAVTVGPGLSLCLSVGVEKAVRLAAELQKPLLRIHHMEAHAMVTRMPMKADQVIPDFPYLTLLVSGGHNMVVLTEGLGKHRILGSTLDDSVGEAFDKTSRLLGITKIPGGPHLERMAKEGDDKKFFLPKPLCNSRDVGLKKGCDFSYSGLKTGVKALIEKHCPLDSTVVATNATTEGAGKDKEEGKKPAAEIQTEEDPVKQQARKDIAAVFQKVAVAHLVERTDRAIVRAQEHLDATVNNNPDNCAEESKKKVKTLVVAGGVAANGLVRAEISKLAKERGLEILIPPPKYCVDNGVMVAWTGVERLLQGLYDDPPSKAENAHYFFETRPRWPLGERDGKSNNFKERISKEMKQKAAADAAKHQSSGSATNKRAAEDENATEAELSKRAQKRLKKAEYLAERKQAGNFAGEAEAADAGADDGGKQ
ncbi:unnamed protein product [Amoebophrya sp. A120]|nr:unnamed protein product [Amoebophrya sp. A120]|eukprot:GSA120T00021556001.1